MPPSRIENGFIIPPAHLELIVADHCNLSCRNCNHASPVSPPWFIETDDVRRDYGLLAKVYRPKLVKVLGGEPLLHPRLAEVIETARETEISQRFLLTTNGLLLHKMDDSVMEIIDELEISVYPGLPRARETIELASEMADRFGKDLTVCEYRQFRQTFSTVGTDDESLVQKIYAACKIAHVWGCHAVREGYFYQCPQRIYIRQLMNGTSFPESDRIRLVDSPDLQARLLAFVNSPIPSSSCRYCLGTVGKQVDHSFVPRGRWEEELEQPTEDLVDHDWLERSLIKQDLIDDCKIMTELESGRMGTGTLWERFRTRFNFSGSRAFPVRRRAEPVRQTAADAARALSIERKEVDDPSP